MMKKVPEVSIDVNGYDCTGSIDSRSNPKAADLFAIGRTFMRAGEAMIHREHGAIECEKNLANIGVDFGGPYDETKGLPVIAKIKIVRQKK
jgi:hypothetical protein